MKIGTHHVRMETDLKPKRHIDQIKTRVQNFKDQCDKAATNLELVYCRAEVHGLENAAENVIHGIESFYPVNTQKRVKRDGKGAIQKIWEWLVGSDDVEEGLHSSKSMGILKHAVSSFKDIERKLQTREQHVEEEMTRLSRGIDLELRKSRWYENQAYVSNTLLSVYQRLLDQLKVFEHTYTELEQIVMTAEEIDAIIDLMDGHAEVGQVPRVTQPQLHKLMTVTKIITKNEASVVIGIPMTLKDVFNEYYVMPVPRNGTNNIPDVAAQAIIINQKLQQFISQRELIEINETLAMTATPVNMFQKLTANSVIAIDMCNGCNTSYKTRLWHVARPGAQW